MGYRAAAGRVSTPQAAGHTLVIMPVALNAAVIDILDRPNPAVLGTINPDGSPQTSVVWVGRDGADLLISTADGRRKVRNVSRDPRVSLCVYDQADPEQYVEVRGLAAVTEDAGLAAGRRARRAVRGAGRGPGIPAAAAGGGPRGDSYHAGPAGRIGGRLMRGLLN